MKSDHTWCRCFQGSGDLKGILTKLCNLHMLARIEADLPYFIESGLISVKQGEEALETSRKLCAEIAPLSMDLIDAFGLPEEVLAAPIASGMVTNAIPFYFPSSMS